jgi:DNA-binding MarR family transcriptional regulator
MSVRRTVLSPSSAGRAEYCSHLQSWPPIRSFAVDDGALVGSWLRLRADLEAVGAALAAEVEAVTGLTMTGFQVLGRLALEPGRTVPMSELARQLRFTTGGLTKLCDRLVVLGLIERHGAARDRRVVLALLTERGAKVAAIGLGAYAAALRRVVVGPIGEDGVEQLAALAASLAAAAQRRDGCAGTRRA